MVIAAALLTSLVAHQSLPYRTRSELAASTPIEHLVVIMKENHAFDNYFGTFPGAEGIPPGIEVPDAYGGHVVPHWLNASSTPDLPHGREDMLQAYHAGLNDGFASVAERWGRGLGNYSLGYFDRRQIPGYWDLASRFVLADHYFQSVFGPTIPNRLYALAGQSGGIVENPIIQQEIDIPTVLDQLQERGIPWRYYYSSHTNWPPLPLFFPRLKSNRDMVAKLSPLEHLQGDIRRGALAAVTYVDPGADLNISEHPPSNITAGELWTMEIIREIMAGPNWASTAVLLTWDEAGGYYDHLPPPQVDAWGYGFRVPLLIISPFSRGGRVDHEVMDHTSILKLIARNWNLPYLTGREARANDMSSAFDFRVQPSPSPGPAFWFPPLKILGGSSRGLEESVFAKGVPKSFTY